MFSPPINLPNRIFCYYTRKQAEKFVRKICADVYYYPALYYQLITGEIVGGGLRGLQPPQKRIKNASGQNDFQKI